MHALDSIFFRKRKEKRIEILAEPVNLEAFYGNWKHDELTK
jgi:hypothetical protein